VSPQSIAESEHAGADPGLLIESATKEVHDARRRHRRQVVESTRLRRLVERVDSAIELCEETHLQGIKEVPPDVAQRARKVFTFARGAVRKTNNTGAVAAVEEALSRRQVKITEVMDILWTIQEIVFDLMLPWRTELPEDVEIEGDELAIGPGFWREFRLHP
jgi:ribosomal protein S20